MTDGRARRHGSADMHCFGHLRATKPSAELSEAVDAIRALNHMGDAKADQRFFAPGERTL